MPITQECYFIRTFQVRLRIWRRACSPALSPWDTCNHVTLCDIETEADSFHRASARCGSARNAHVIAKDT